MKVAWSTACPDWATRIRRGDPIIPPPIFPDQAAQALEVFKQLRIVDAPGSPTFGEACKPWVFDLVASIFGAYDARPGSPTEGRRLITEWFVLVPKKNMKSTLGAGIMMTALLMNWRRSAEFTILAPTIEVAGNSFSPARDFCQESVDPELSALLHVQSHVKTLTHRVSNATLKVIAADSNTASGKKSVGTLIDELWLFGKQPHAENMFREAIGGLASRPEGFVVYLTTQSDDPPAGVFRKKLQYARGVRDGTIVDPRFVPVIYEFPDDMIARHDHKNPSNFWMVNPNMGRSVDAEFLNREFHKAENDGEESLRGFLAKHLNVEMGLALKSDRWRGADFWEAAARPITLEEILRRCDAVDVGIDGGGLDDLLGLYVLGRDPTSREWLGWGRAWVHESVLELRKSEASKLRDFEKAGELRIVGQVGEDVEEVAEIVSRVHEAGVLDKVGLDPAGVGSILDALVMRDIPQDKVVGVSQGWRLGGAVKTAERKLADGSLVHADQALMNWCVGNAKIEPRANSILVTKQASGTGKIDPVIALFNATHLMALSPPAVRKKFQIFALGARAA